MPTPVTSVSDGSRTTVADLVGAPKAIPSRIIQLLDNAFLSNVLLRDEGGNTNGLVEYSESTPLYLDADVEAVGEFAEIPVAAGQIGLPRIAFGTKKGLGIRVSKEMVDENKMGQVNRQIIQLANTMVRAENRVIRRLLSDPSIPTIAAGATWDSTNGRPRRDVANAMEAIGSATPFTTATPVDDDVFGFEADTSVMSPALAPVLMDNDNFISVFRDTLAGENIRYTGKLGKDLMGLAALTARAWPKDRVLICERGTLGFFSDTRILQSTGLYPEGGGGNGGPTETWRSDTTRKRVYGIDQPKSACWITGVVTL